MLSGAETALCLKSTTFGLSKLCGITPPTTAELENLVKLVRFWCTINIVLGAHFKSSDLLCRLVFILFVLNRCLQPLI